MIKNKENPNVSFQEDMFYWKAYQAYREYEQKGMKWDMDCFGKWLSEKTFKTYDNWEDFDVTELHSVNDDRYPRPYWLSCLAHGMLNKLNFDTLIEQLKHGWYSMTEDSIQKISDDEYSYYTGGWSGNEDIIDALLSMVRVNVNVVCEEGSCIWHIKRLKR